MPHKNGCKITVTNWERVLSEKEAKVPLILHTKKQKEKVRRARETNELN